MGAVRRSEEQPVGGFGVKRVLETCIYVNDLGAAARFYGDVLGLRLHTGEEGRHVFFRCGEGMFLVFEPEASAEFRGLVPTHGAHGPGHVAFSVELEEIDAWRDHLGQHGVEIETEVNWPVGGISLYFRDPAGNSVELATPLIWAPSA
jgi:catechol 2,3-dioxygenase-like lactoylglutathione lyase family enzyme